ncbi:MAG: DUF1854 domain-containing protein [Spirochaetes bacterium]|nr:DUF1854 domain-containing protein [Spirochaetota bacterium]
MKLNIQRRADGRLVYKVKGKKDGIPVKVVSAFPWSHPHKFISIRDDKGKEQLLIDSLDSINKAERELISTDLAERNFIPRILSIQSIIEERELFHWNVVTDAGARSFLTNRHDHPRTLETDEVLIKDVSNDLYLIPELKALDKKSLKLLWVYLD